MRRKITGVQLKTVTDTPIFFFFFFFGPIIVCAHVAFLKQNEDTCTYLKIAE